MFELTLGTSNGPVNAKCWRGGRWDNQRREKTCFRGEIKKVALYFNSKVYLLLFLSLKAGYYKQLPMVNKLKDVLFSYVL